MDYDDFDNGYDSDPVRSSPDYDLSNDQGRICGIGCGV